ncbi:MAG: ligase OB-like domain, partial [Firmicutes bacterium]|nr:ligase OB-like domain [Bacillota bacterium]
PGTGKNEGLIGSINFQNGRCSGMTDEFRTWATSHQNELIGRTMEIGYMERTEAGCYRHPVFIQIREDK